MNDLHVLYKFLAYSQERSREYWGIRWSGTGSIKHNAIQKFAKEKKKLTSIWGFLLVPLKKRLLAKIFSRWYLSVALAFPCWKEEKRRKAEKRKGKKKKGKGTYIDFFNSRHLPVALAFAYWKWKWTDHLELSRISFSWSKEKWRFKKYLKLKNVPCCRVYEKKKVSFSKIPVDDGNGKDFHFPLARLHIQSLSFLVRWTFYEICPIRTGNNRDESGGDCEFAFKHRANICLQTSSMPINISFPDNATDKLKMKKGLGGLILIVVKPL